MEIYLNRDKNHMVLIPKNFEMNRNYIPDLFFALRELDRNRPIDVFFLFEKTPVVFILFFDKIINKGEANIKLHFKENTEELRIGLKTFNLLDKSDWNLNSLDLDFFGQTSDDSVLVQTSDGNVDNISSNS